jgi:hypothetical protein
MQGLDVGFKARTWNWNLKDPSDPDFRIDQLIIQQLIKCPL